MQVDFASPTPPDAVVFLNGRPPLREFLDFVKGQSLGGQVQPERQLADDWRAANDHIVQLEAAEAGWADNAIIASVALELEPLKQQVLAHAATQRAFSVVPASVGVVELDRLVVFQKHINLRYVHELRQQLGDSPSPEHVFRFCLPLDPALPQVQLRQGQGGFVFQSPSMDFRCLEIAPLDPKLISGLVTPGWPATVVGLVVGYGINFVQVVSAEGRLILGNGSHRAFALREAGLTHAPVLVQSVSRRDELAALAMPDIQINPDAYLKAPRPPLLKDYFDDKLRKLMTVPRSSMQLRVGFGVEATIAPT